jgi:uncharacterized protein (DUF2336 family)
MTADVALLREVEAAATNVSGRQRSEMLRRVTDLFIVGAPQYTDDQIALFDDVFVRLALEIESSARALLAARLAPIPNAPPGTIRSLAFDSEIDVAGPILSQSERLDDCALIENASEMSQEHLFAISQRRHLNAAVTDVLVERGDRVVAMSTVSNSGARFSEGGFAKLVGRSEGDDELAERVGARPEIPPLLFRRLLLAASEHVRAKLESEHPWAKRQVRVVVGEATARIGAQSLAESGLGEDDDGGSQHDHFNEGGLIELATRGHSQQVAAVLSRMCGLPASFIEDAMNEERADTILVLLRAAGLPWPVAKTILAVRARRRAQSATDLAKSLAAFERLSPDTAKQIVEFYRQRRLGRRAETD